MQYIYLKYNPQIPNAMELKIPRTLILAIAMASLSCNGNNYDYSKAIQENTKRIFLEKKSLMKALAFRGMIVGKKLCERCDLNKYNIRIRLEEMSQEVPFEDLNYAPYYSFNDDFLNLTVNYSLYNTLVEGDYVTKAKDSSHIESHEKKLEILNSQEDIWLP